jgi:hypothetical protein
VFGRRRAIVAVLATAAAVAALGPAQDRPATPRVSLADFITNPPPAQGSTVLASVSDAGGPLIDSSAEPQISGDGKWELFTTDSYACGGCSSPEYDQPDPLGDPNADVFRVFARNMDPNAPALHRTIEVSVGNSDLSGKSIGDIITPNGEDPDSYTQQGSISTDGRYVSFLTYANNIVPIVGGAGQTLVVCDRDPDGDGVYDEVVTAGAPGVTQTRDYRCRGIYPTSPTEPGVDSSTTPQLSPNGRWIVWAQFGGNVQVARVSDSTGLLTQAAAGSPITVDGIPGRSNFDATMTNDYVVMLSQNPEATDPQAIVRTRFAASPQQVVRIDNNPADAADFLGKHTYTCSEST